MKEQILIQNWKLAWIENAALKAQGIDIFTVLKNNDAYNALAKCDGLVITGPTGTNVNDVAVALLDA